MTSGLGSGNAEERKWSRIRRPADEVTSILSSAEKIPTLERTQVSRKERKRGRAASVVSRSRFLGKSRVGAPPISAVSKRYGRLALTLQDDDLECSKSSSGAVLCSDFVSKEHRIWWCFLVEEVWFFKDLYGAQRAY